MFTYPFKTCLKLQVLLKTWSWANENMIAFITWSIFAHNSNRIEYVPTIYIIHYYMALSHKDWELPNSRIWLAQMDIDRSLDFPI